MYCGCLACCTQEHVKLDRASAVLSGGEGVVPACLQDWSSLLIHTTGVFSAVDSLDRLN
jgi:hypothetical protein